MNNFSMKIINDNNITISHIHIDKLLNYFSENII